MTASLDLLTGPEIAAMLGIKPSTWRTLVSTGRAPGPDVVGADGRARWSAAAITVWNAGRPGRGGGATRANRLRAMVRRATGGEVG